ncbi:MAG TPA: wax ester/triacylglycerol synthase family O-acyltransferase [Acidimicrobiia bacterium]|nr:wax ester/triacylglycerol synthase family O-acyltransferase [Acidimicrobiia bacterium]
MTDPGTRTASVQPHFEPLSHLDASFLALESPSTHMHVGAVVQFEAAQLKLADGGIDIARIKAHILGKLQYIPRYRQRLAFVPATRHPVWVDDDHFNFDYHVRHTSLPRPGTDEQLKLLAGRIVSQQLDRAKPLWELWVVEGLEDDRFAVIAKIHHCMIDGVSGIDLTGILLNVVPTTALEAPDDWTPRPAPTNTQMVVAEAARVTRRTIDSMSSLRSLRTRSRELAMVGGGKAFAAFNSLRSGWLSSASRTPLNPDVGPNRRVDWTESSLDDIKEIRRALGGSINDVLLAVVAGAIRQFLTKERRFDVDGIEFRAMVPVSTRQADQRGSLGNQVAMWLVNMPLSEPAPLLRLQKVHEETARLKQTNQALGASTLVELSRGTPLTLISMANRVVGPIVRPFNLTVTNVPGPQFPMYLLEAKMIASFPIVPLWSQHGLGLAIFSYDGKLHWGIHADFDAIPDTDRVAAAISTSIEELLEAARAK